MVVVVVDAAGPLAPGGPGVMAGRVLGRAALAAGGGLAAGVEGADGLGLVGLALAVQQLVQNLGGDRGRDGVGRVPEIQREGLEKGIVPVSSSPVQHKVTSGRPPGKVTTEISSPFLGNPVCNATGKRVFTQRETK